MNISNILIPIAIFAGVLGLVEIITSLFEYPMSKKVREVVKAIRSYQEKRRVAKKAAEATKKRIAEEKVREKAKAPQYWMNDWHFNPITWNYGFRPAVSLIAGLFVASAVKLVFWGLFLVNVLPVDPITNYLMLCIIALVAIAIARPETDENGNPVVENVPGIDFGALVTVLGMPLPIIRTTGEYTWLGKRLGLDRSRKALVGIVLKDDNTPIEQGYIPLGDVTFPIWDSAHPDPNKPEEKFQITIPAKNRAPITGSLTLILNLFKPRLWLKAVDPALDLGDRARQEYQEMVEMLIDTDVAAIQAEMEKYLLGKPMVTAFVTKNPTTKSAGSTIPKAGAMVRDKSGKVMLHMVEPDESLERAIIAFRDRLIEKADPDMLKAITTKKSGAPDEIAVTVVKVSDPLTEVTTSRGATLVRVTFGDVKLSKKVSDAAEQASAEADERRAQLDSAKTVKEGRKILMPTPTELKNREMFELTTVLAAAQDDKFGNIRVVMVPGGNQLAGSIIAAGGQMGEKK